MAQFHLSSLPICRAFAASFGRCLRRLRRHRRRHQFINSRMPTLTFLFDFAVRCEFIYFVFILFISVRFIRMLSRIFGVSICCTPTSVYTSGIWACLQICIIFNRACRRAPANIIPKYASGAGVTDLMDDSAIPSRKCSEDDTSVTTRLYTSSNASYR